MSVEAFIFDIGNVLLRFDYSRAYATMRRTGEDPDMAVLESLAKRYERGEVARADFLLTRRA